MSGSAGSGVWVFGYGSLVDHRSFGSTLGRELRPGVDHLPAALDGFGRRWNYGVGHVVGRWTDERGVDHERTIVALGLERHEGGTVNGVVAWVHVDELAHLDRRERHYDRVDVTDLVTVTAAAEVVEPGRIVTYVPRPEAVERYAAARDSGTAAIERRYWDLVDAAFALLGPAEHERYHASTPPPDVPVLPLVRS